MNFRIWRKNGLWLLVVGVLLTAAVGALAASWIPFRILAEKVRAASSSGQGSFFNEQFYEGLQFRLRVIGLLNLLLAAVLVPVRTRIGKFAAALRTDVSSALADARQSLASIPLFDALAVFALTFVAAWLRFELLFQPIRGDEACTFMEYASHPLYVGLSFYNLPNNHLLGTFLMHYSYLLLGSHTWALRVPVFLAGICLVPATYLASRSLYRIESGLMAAGLITASSILIDFSTNARGYIFVCLAVVLMIPAAAHALRTGNRASWLLLAVLSAIGSYAVPIMLYPFCGILLWLVLCSWFGDEGTDIRSVVQGVFFLAVVTGIASFELYAPVVAVSGPSALLSNKWVRPLPLHRFIHDLPYSFISTWQQWHWDFPPVLEWTLGIAFLVALVFHARSGRQRVALPIAMVAAILPMLVLQRVAPFERVWLFAVPVYFLVASNGIALALVALRGKSRYVMALTVMAVVLIVTIKARRSQTVYLSNEGRGFEQLAIYLKSNLKAGDSVLAVLSSEGPMRYYFRQYGVPFSYLNTTGGDRVLVVVNEVSKEETMQGLFNYAKRSDLHPQDAAFVTRFDSLDLYEIGRN